MGGPLPPWTAFQVSWDMVTEATELACLNLPTCGQDTICSHVFTSASQPCSKEILPLAVTGRVRRYLQFLRAQLNKAQEELKKKELQ